MRQRFAIRFSRTMAVFLTALASGPRQSYVDVSDDEAVVRMGWCFSGSIPRTSIRSAGGGGHVALSRGVHGWRGRWLVNGSGDGMVELNIDPPAPGRLLSLFPLKLRHLWVSLEEPEEFLAVLGVPPNEPARGPRWLL